MSVQHLVADFPIDQRLSWNRDVDRGPDHVRYVESSGGHDVQHIRPGALHLRFETILQRIKIIVRRDASDSARTLFVAVDVPLVAIVIDQPYPAIAGRRFRFKPFRCQMQPLHDERPECHAVADDDDVLVLIPLSIAQKRTECFTHPHRDIEAAFPKRPARPKFSS